MNNPTGRGGNSGGADLKKHLLLGACVLIIAGSLAYVSLRWSKITGGDSVVIAPTPESIQAAAPTTDDMQKLNAMSLDELEKELARRESALNSTRARGTPGLEDLQDSVDRCHEVYLAKKAKAEAPVTDSPAPSPK